MVAPVRSGIRIHTSRSPQSVAIGAWCRVFVKNAVRLWALHPNLGWPMGSIDRIAGLLPQPISAVTQRITLPNCRAELIGTGGSGRRAILYLHGGAFLTCGLNTHRSLVARLAKAADAEVLNVAYRMLPAHGLASAVDDALDGMDWLRQRGYRPDEIVIAGDSAGGYLALATTLELIRRGRPGPAGVAAISPLTDLDPERKLARRGAGSCAMFPLRALSMFARAVRRGGMTLPAEDGREVLSPADADLSDMPPVAIHASMSEILLPDAELMFRRLVEAGTPCDLHLWHGQIHDFPLAADVLPEGRHAIGHLGEFTKNVTRSQRVRSGNGSLAKSICAPGLATAVTMPVPTGPALSKRVDVPTEMPSEVQCESA